MKLASRRLRAALMIAFGAALLTAGSRYVQTVQAAGISYAAGWNLIAGPDGSTVTGAIGSLYTLGPDGVSYQTLATTSTLQGGVAYWAYFPSAGSLKLPATAVFGSKAVAGAADTWQMVGNPSSISTIQLVSPSADSGDVALTFDSKKNQYAAATSLKVGQGAWVITKNGLVLTDPAVTPPVAPTRPAPPASPNSH